jgi:hypothetical protein
MPHSPESIFSLDNANLKILFTVIAMRQARSPMTDFLKDCYFNGSVKTKNFVLTLHYAAWGGVFKKSFICVLLANTNPYRKRVLPVYQGPRGSCLMKKTRGRKSRAMVPLSMQVIILQTEIPIKNRSW